MTGARRWVVPVAAARALPQLVPWAEWPGVLGLAVCDPAGTGAASAGAWDALQRSALVVRSTAGRPAGSPVLANGVARVLAVLALPEVVVEVRTDGAGSGVCDGNHGPRGAVVALADGVLAGARRTAQGVVLVLDAPSALAGEVVAAVPGAQGDGAAGRSRRVVSVDAAAAAAGLAGEAPVLGSAAGWLALLVASADDAVPAGVEAWVRDGAGWWRVLPEARDDCVLLEPVVPGDLGRAAVEGVTARCAATEEPA